MIIDQKIYQYILAKNIIFHICLKKTHISRKFRKDQESLIEAISRHIIVNYRKVKDKEYYLFRSRGKRHFIYGRLQ